MRGKFRDLINSYWKGSCAENGMPGARNIVYLGLLSIAYLRGKRINGNSY